MIDTVVEDTFGSIAKMIEFVKTIACIKRSRGWLQGTCEWRQEQIWREEIYSCLHELTFSFIHSGDSSTFPTGQIPSQDNFTHFTQPIIDEKLHFIGYLS